RCAECGFEFFAKAAKPSAETVGSRYGNERATWVPSYAESLHIMLWVGGFFIFLVSGAMLASDIRRAESAPQQAAAAAMSIGYMVVWYGLLRAISEILKTIFRR